MPDRKRPRSFKRVDQVLNQVVAALGLNRRLREHTLAGMWPALVGEPFALSSRVLFLDAEENLVVAVADASTGQELSMAKPQILKRLKCAAAAVGLNVSGIRFDLKHFHCDSGSSESGLLPHAREAPEPSEEALAAVVLTGEEKQELERLKLSLHEQSPAYLDVTRIEALCERRLKIRRWQLQSGYPRCRLCEEPTARLHGRHQLCPVCYFRDHAQGGGKAAN